MLVFDETTSERVELDLRGSDQDVIARLNQDAETAEALDSAVVSDDQPGVGAQAGPGRPKLGVVAREVTLLPRHWEWLNTQPGGASVALRKLVEEALRAAASKDRIRHSQESTYLFLSAIAGNLPDFEEATRALFAGDGGRFDTLTDGWPDDIREHARKLAAPAFEKENP